MGGRIESSVERRRSRRDVSVEEGFEKVSRGSWGEERAARFLESRGWKIIGRNVRPCQRDRRCEIDIVANPGDARKVVFVEVKTHARRGHGSERLVGIDARKKRVLLRACANWVMGNRWHGDFRLDVVEVYGTPSETVAIDHIENVPLFPPKWRFW